MVGRRRALSTCPPGLVAPARVVDRVSPSRISLRSTAARRPAAVLDCEPLPVDLAARSTARAPPTPPHARAPHPSHPSHRLTGWAKTAGFRPVFVSSLPNGRANVTRETGGAALARSAPAQRSEVGYARGPTHGDHQDQPPEQGGTGDVRSRRSPHRRPPSPSPSRHDGGGDGCGCPTRSSPRTRRSGPPGPRPQ